MAAELAGVKSRGAEDEIIGKLIDHLKDGMIEVLVSPGGGEIPDGGSGTHGGFACGTEEIEVAFLIEADVRGRGLPGVGADLCFRQVARQFRITANGGDVEAGFGMPRNPDSCIREQPLIALTGMLARSTLRLVGERTVGVEFSACAASGK